MSVDEEFVPPSIPEFLACDRISEQRGGESVEGPQLGLVSLPADVQHHPLTPSHGAVVGLIGVDQVLVAQPDDQRSTGFVLRGDHGIAPAHDHIFAVQTDKIVSTHSTVTHQRVFE